MSRSLLSQCVQAMCWSGLFFLLIAIAPAHSQTPGGVSGNLTLWLKADAGVTTSGNNVTQWADQSGNGRHFTQGVTTLQPILSANRLNTYPAVTFDSSDRLEKSLETVAQGTFYAVIHNAQDSAFLGESLIGDSQIELRIEQFNDTKEMGVTVFFTSGLPNPDDYTASPAVASPFGDSALLTWLYGSGSTIYKLEVQGTGTNIETNIDTLNSTRHLPLQVIGNDANFNNPYLGNILEVVLYDSMLSANNRQQVESYLALKYGLTLDQNKPTDYLSSDGTVIFDASNVFDAFDHNIAGIGQDNSSGLLQTQSTSANSDRIVTMSTPSAMSNGEFLLWGHNNGALSITFTNTPVDRNRLTRIWRVDHTGDVGTVTVAFDLANVAMPGNRAADFTMVIDTDTDFSSGAAQVPASSFANGVVTFNGITLPDNALFTLLSSAPGGVATNLQLWLKADADVFSDGGSTMAISGDTVQQWHDQSTQGHEAAQGDAGKRPTLLSNTMNFNPALHFDGGGDTLDIPTLNISPSAMANMSAFIVFESDTALDTPIRKLYGHDNTGFDRSIGLDHRASLNFGYHDGTGLSDYFTLIANTPYLSSHVYSDGTPDQFRGGINGALTTGPATVTDNDGLSTLSIGGVGAIFNEFWDGPIAEFVIYNTLLTTAQRHRIESYLAIKYGITLASSVDYVSSTGDVIYKSTGGHSGYVNDIAGIGQDNGSGLVQLQSRSVNSDRLITLSAPSAIASGEFLVWGNNNGSFARITTGTPAGLTRLTRLWRMAETGDVGTVTITFDTTSLGGTNGALASDFKLLIDANDTDLSDISAMSASSVTDTEITFTTVSPIDNAFFTLAFADADADGVPDSVEDRNLDGDHNPATGPSPDTDGDGIPDYLDPTDDGNGDADTAAEDANGNGNPRDDDSDGDGIPDYLDPDDGGPGFGDSHGDGTSDAAECPSGPPCTDTDGDGVPNYNDPDHNTDVTLWRAHARAHSQGVTLTWATSWEMANLGFHAYREIRRKRVQLTPELIAGSAFITGSHTALSAGHTYHWVDVTDHPDDVYWLADVDLHGTRTWHGPVRPTQPPVTTRKPHRPFYLSYRPRRLGLQSALKLSPRRSPIAPIALTSPRPRTLCPGSA